MVDLAPFLRVIQDSVNFMVFGIFNHDIRHVYLCVAYSYLNLNQNSKMPIKSYILIPHLNQMNALSKKLEGIKEVEIEPSENKQVIVAVTDTPNEDSDKELVTRLEACLELAHLTLVSGFEENAI